MVEKSFLSKWHFKLRPKRQEWLSEGLGEKQSRQRKQLMQKVEDGNRLGALRNRKEASEAGAERVGDG